MKCGSYDTVSAYCSTYVYTYIGQQKTTQENANIRDQSGIRSRDPIF
jgi:hypothetical protein